MLILGLGIGYFVFNKGIQTSDQETVHIPKTEGTDITPTPTTVVDNNTMQWKEVPANSLAPFSFEYPSGWHVAEFRLDTLNGSPVLIALSTEPISLAPDGPTGKIQIDYEWTDNVQELLKQEVTEVKEFLVNVEEEQIEGKNGTIYHISGTTPEGFLGNLPSEDYFLTFENSNNTAVINISTINQSDLSKMLRHIALSIN